MTLFYINFYINVIDILQKERFINTNFITKLEMQLKRPSNMQRLALSKFIGLTSLYLGPLIKIFVKRLFLMIRRSLINICSPISKRRVIKFAW